MKKLLLYFLTIVSILCFNSSCNEATKFLCGEMEGKEKLFVDSLNTCHTNKLFIKSVPCYPGYLQINLKGEVKKAEIDSLEIFLKSKNYIEVLIYDLNNNLIKGNVGSM